MGERFTVTLNFKSGKSQDVTITVGGPASKNFEEVQVVQALEEGKEVKVDEKAAATAARSRS